MRGPSQPHAQVVKLVDTLASGASELRLVEVQVLSWAPNKPCLTARICRALATAGKALSTLIALLCLAPAAMADTTPWFGSVNLSLGDAHMDHIANTIGTGAVIDNQVDGRLEHTLIEDETAGIGISFGRRMGNWRLESELIWRYRTDWDLVASTDSIQAITNIFSNVRTTSLTINVLRRTRFAEKWSWEIGAGAGLVLNQIDADYVERLSQEFRVSDKNSSTEFTYGVLAGLVRAFEGPWSLGLRYRYIDFGELEVGPFPFRTAEAATDYRSHEFQISLERRF